MEAKQSETPKKSLRPLPPSRRSKLPVSKPSATGDASADNEPIPLAKPRPAEPRQAFSEKPSIAASYVASLGSSVPPTKPSPGTLSSSAEAAAADRRDQIRKEPDPASRVAEESQDSLEPTRVDVSQQALAPKAEPPEPLDVDADEEDTEVVDRATVLASRRQAQKERDAEAENTSAETLLPPSTPTAASGQAMEVIRREASAMAASAPAEEEHPPPATETDAPVAMDLTPTDVPEPTEPATDLYLAAFGKAREAWHSPRARWAAGAGVLVIGIAALLMLTSESSDPGEAELAATLPAAAEQVAVPQPDQPDVTSKASSPAPADEPEAAETSEPEPLAIRTVAVQAHPANAVIYSGGQRLGKGAVEVRLAAGEQKVLWVKCDGYASRQVVLDGSATEIDVALVKRGAADSVGEQPVAEPAPEADSPAEPEVDSPAEPAAPDPLAVSVPNRDDPYASVPDAEPSPGKGTTPARDDPRAAVPSGKSAPGRWEDSPGF